MYFFFSSKRRHTRFDCDWSSDVCSSDLSPKRISAAASTMRVFPEPVGPRNSRFPTGRPGEFNPARKTWYRSTSACTPSSCPTIFARSAAWKSKVSVLRLLGSSARLSASSRLRMRSEEHTSELQSQSNLVCRLLLEKKKKKTLSSSKRESDSLSRGRAY